MRQRFGDRKHGFIFQIMENGTKEKEELGAAYLQENFDVGGTADEVQYTFFFTYFFVFFCPIFPDQQMSGMFNKLNGPILSSWQYAPGLNLFSSQWKSSCPINYILNKYPLHYISINKQNRQNLHFREGYPFTSSHFEP